MTNSFELNSFNIQPGIISMNRTTTKFVSIIALIATLGMSAVTAAPSNAGHQTKQSMKAKAPALDIVQTAVKTETLSTLVALVKAAGLVEALSGKGPFTVFAPDNKAFTTLAKNPQDPAQVEAAIAKLVANPKALAEVLKFHVVPGNYTAAMLKNNMKLKTLTGEELTVKKYTNGKVKIADKNGKILAMVTTADVKTKNGTVHVVDGVLLSKMPMGKPKDEMPNPAPEMPKPPMPPVMNGEPNLSTLMKVLEVSGLIGAFDGTNKYTVLAPDNRAFAKLSKNPDDEALVEKDMAALVANKDLLLKVLSNHVFDGIVKFEDLTDGRVLYNILGDAVRVKRMGPDNVQLIDDTSGVAVTVTTRNIDKPYGIVHVVSEVLLP
jgi:uncharacterized surface protein with fasciclin (FAS1) repeats